MQNRMKTHALEKQEIDALLAAAQVGTLSTLNIDGTPYNTPVHFVYWNQSIYIHGLSMGQKIDNIVRDKRVGFSVYEMKGLLLSSDAKPCSTNTQYQSAVISGIAELITEREAKTELLHRIIEKYTPQLKDAELPANAVSGTTVIKLEIAEITGKYYK